MMVTFWGLLLSPPPLLPCAMLCPRHCTLFAATLEKFISSSASTPVCANYNSLSALPVQLSASIFSDYPVAAAAKLTAWTGLAMSLARMSATEAQLSPKEILIFD